MNVLALDTATPYLVLGTLEAERVLKRGRRHAETLADDLTAFLNDVDLERQALDLVVVGEGPGSYTGLRVGLALALGMARGLGLPVVGASSLAAAAARGRGLVRPVWTARNHNLYTAAYHVDGMPQETSPPEKRPDPPGDGCLLWNAPPSGRALARIGLERWRSGKRGVAPIYM